MMSHEKGYDFAYLNILEYRLPINPMAKAPRNDTTSDLLKMYRFAALFVA